MTLWLLLVVVAALAGWAGLEARRWRSRLRALGAVLEPGSAEVRGYFSSYALSGRHGGRPAELRFVTGSRSHRARFEASLGCSAALEFAIGLQGLGDWVAERLHLARDIAIGEPALDERFVFHSPEPERFAAWFRSSDAARRAVETLFETYGARSLWTDEAMLGFDREGSGCFPGPEDARQFLELLQGMAESAERA